MATARILRGVSFLTPEGLESRDLLPPLILCEPQPPPPPHPLQPWFTAVPVPTPLLLYVFLRQLSAAGYNENSKAFECFRFILEFADLFEFVNIRRWLRWRGVLSLSTESVVRLTLKVYVEWDSTSTEATQNHEIFINVGAFCVDSVDVGSPRWRSVGAVDVVSHLALTQFMGSLTPHWLSLRGVSLRTDSMCRRWIKPKQAYCI